MSATMTGPAPQPTAVMDNTIETILRVAEMASMALQMIPGIPPSIAPIISTTLTDIQAAYMAYKANPTADLLVAIQAVVDQGFADVNAALHPVP